jgi:hypothetical protein
VLDFFCQSDEKELACNPSVRSSRLGYVGKLFFATASLAFITVHSLRMYHVAMEMAVIPVIFYAIRPDGATIDHACYDWVGQATCPKCRVRYEIYAGRFDGARLGHLEIIRLLSPRISAFEEAMEKTEPVTHTEDVHPYTWRLE